MDTGIEIVQPIWLDSDLLTDFIDELRESGYRIGVSQYIAVQDLMVALANQGKLPDNPERLRTLLAPILCSSPTEQEDFQYRFDDWVELIRLKEEKKNEISVKEVFLEKMVKSRWRFQRLILPITAIIFAGIFLRILTSTPSPVATNSSTPSPVATNSSTPSPVATNSSTSSPVATNSPTPSPVATNSDFHQEWQANNAAFFVLALCLVFLGWRLWWFWRAQLFLERRSTRQQPELHNISIDSFKHNLLPLVPFIQIARHLRQRIRISSNEIDINKTIEASLRRGGWLTPVYGFRQIIPEYLFLIDRSSFRDHQAKFAEEIIDNLRHNGVFITSYYFDDNPLICFPSDGVNHPQKLNEIAVKHHQHRLIIIADVDRLYDSATGELENWVSQISTWGDQAILTPKPVESWGYRELELAQQFIVLPTNPNGFQILGQLFSQGKANFSLTEGNQTPLPEILRTRPHRWIENSPPDTKQIDVLLSSLQQYLGKDGFYWLSACAVYPELHWNITIYLGNAIKAENGHSLLETSSVINLARLPWFRYGYMPNWLRYRLIQILPSIQERTIRFTLQGLLVIAVERQSTGGFQLNVAQQQHSFLTRLVGSILSVLSMRLSENSPLQDYTFLRFMIGNSSLAVKVPNKFSRLLKQSKKNYWLVGIVIAIIVTVALSLSISYYQQFFNLETKVANPFFLDADISYQLYNNLTGHTGWVRTVAFFPNGFQFASGSYDRTLRLWNVYDNQSFETLSNHLGSISGINALAVHPDGNTFATACIDKSIKLWNFRSGQPIRSLEGHEGQVYSVAYSPDGKTLISASADRTIKLWNWQKGEILQTFKGHQDKVVSVASHPNGKGFASASFDQTIKIWDMSTGTEVLNITGHTAPINAIAFSPDGKLLVSGSQDQTVKIWDLSTGKVLRTLSGHTGGALAVAFNRDGSAIASGGADKTIRIWNVKTGEVKQILSNHEAPVLSLSFSPKDATLVSGSADRSVKVWKQPER